MLSEQLLLQGLCVPRPLLARVRGGGRVSVPVVARLGHAPRPLPRPPQPRQLRLEAVLLLLAGGDVGLQRRQLAQAHLLVGPGHNTLQLELEFYNHGVSPSP